MERDASFSGSCAKPDPGEMECLQFSPDDRTGGHTGSRERGCERIAGAFDYEGFLQGSDEKIMIEPHLVLPHTCTQRAA
jgi:hypothetical protein